MIIYLLLANTSFILLRADPALNHSICCSLKVWFKVTSTFDPFCFLKMAVNGFPGAKLASPTMETSSDGSILS
ncbi:hypothetical protein GCK72_008205 [Caenorhabditis remanei]|uniref:Uncharacterized protein n=1 Tax=Caenorhabditis remanei TaxID=31234 RepID=A0A6A5GWV6_CAERE|nr:hypothetical protein GCK72_008205 [Caenorhabditis remanei]KAF1759960.1 hypothetical protein GCK72_008205 [Caenorhabditis remanei]